MKSNNQNVSVKVQGNPNNPSLVLGHALGMNLQAWDSVSDVLSKSYYVVSWDLPGHGKSDPVSADVAQLGELDLVGELINICDELNIDKFHYVGTSIGGVIGQQLAIHYATRLLSLTLTNTGAKIGTTEAWMERKKNVEIIGLKTMNVDIVSRWFSPQSLVNIPSLASTWSEFLAQTDNHSYALLCEWLSKRDQRAKLIPLDIPVSFIAGSDDIATPPLLVRELANTMETKDIDIITNVGHVPSVEVPEIFTDMLLAMLSVK